MFEEQSSIIQGKQQSSHENVRKKFYKNNHNHKKSHFLEKVLGENDFVISETKIAFLIFF